MGQVEQEIKRLWVQSSTGLYGSAEEAAAGFDRVQALMDKHKIEYREQQAEAAAVRRAEREAFAYHGAPTVTTTCGVCGTQHPGEC